MNRCRYGEAFNKKKLVDDNSRRSANNKTPEVPPFNARIGTLHEKESPKHCNTDENPQDIQAEWLYDCRRHNFYNAIIGSKNQVRRYRRQVSLYIPIQAGPFIVKGGKAIGCVRTN